MRPSRWSSDRGLTHRHRRHATPPFLGFSEIMSVLNSVEHGSSQAAPGGRGRRRVLAGISLGYFMVLLDMTVLSVAEPDLSASLHTSVAGLQWATSGYTVTFAALLL